MFLPYFRIEQGEEESMSEKCPCCPKTYQSSNDLDRHLQKIHGLSPVSLRNVPESEKSDFVKQCLKLLHEVRK